MLLLPITAFCQPALTGATKILSFKGDTTFRPTVTQLMALAPDQSATNELQTVANTSNSTTHTVTLSNSGGSVQLAEGSGITLTTTGTSADGVVTIAATGGGGDIVNGGNTGAVVIGTNDATTLSFETNNVVRAVYTGGASTGGALTHTDVTANTNTVESIVTHVVNSSGTAAAGFGQRQLAQLESSTTNAQDAASMDVLWTTATHASRTADVVFSNVNNATSLAETFRIAGNGNLTSTSLVTNTNTAVDALTIRANSTGTPAANFGSSILFQGESATTNNKDMCRIRSYYLDPNNSFPYTAFGLDMQDANGGGLVTPYRFYGTATGEMYIGVSSSLRIRRGDLVPQTDFTIGQNSNNIILGNSSGGVATVSSKSSTTAIEITPSSATDISNRIAVGTVGATNTSGNKVTMEFQQGYTASSGTGTLASLRFGNTINQTSTASGVIRAIQIAPTLTSVTGTYLAVDIDANHANAKGVYQSGTSTTNNFAGNTAFGSTSAPAQSADFYGNVRLRALRMEDYATLAGTGTVTASTTISDNLYKPGSTQATLTLNLPGSPTDMQICSVGFGNIVTTLTVSGNGSTLNGTAPTTAAVGDSFAYKFYSGTGWIKIK